MLGAGDEVGKGIHLLHHATSIAPGLAQLATATNVRDHENNAAIKQSQATGGKARRDGNAVRPVGIEQHRRRTIQLHAALVDHRHWDLCAVRCSREHAFGFVIRFIKTARDLRLFQQSRLARVHVVIKN